MLDKTKTDAKLGKEVNDYLVSKGVQTPMMPGNASESNIRKLFQGVMEDLQLDLTDDSLKDTPRRVAKMYVEEIFWGLRPENFPKATAVENKMKYDEIVLEKNITVMSNCEHHFVPFIGKAHVAYIPNGKVLGLSKLNRIVEYFCRRPQIQERLTEQIYHALAYVLDTKSVLVVIEAEHFCVKTRGVQDTGSSTITSKIGGRFIGDTNSRFETMNLINNGGRK